MCWRSIGRSTPARRARALAADDPKNAEKGRPDPEALLAAANKASRGRLKVFLGMAPGVGKTYEMLRAARRRKAEGGDVLIGVVETHGRRETESLLRGMEVLPRRPVFEAYMERMLARPALQRTLAKEEELAKGA